MTYLLLRILLEFEFKFLLISKYELYFEPYDSSD